MSQMVSFSWSGKGSLKQLSTTTNELCIQAAESGDYYMCCVKKGETASFTVHHFIKTGKYRTLTVLYDKLLVQEFNTTVASLFRINS